MESVLDELPVMPESIKGNKCQSCGASDWGACNLDNDWSVKECDKCPTKPAVGPR